MTAPKGRKTVLTTNPYLILDNQGTILPSFDLFKNYYRLGRDPQQVDFVIPDNWLVVGRCQACLRKVGNNYYIYDGDGTNPSTNRLFYNNTAITPKEGLLLQDGMEIKIGQDPQSWVTLTYHHPDSSLPKKPLSQTHVSLKNQSVLIGRDPNANLVLDAPTISWHHAVIDTDNQGRYILHDQSTNGVFINGQKVNKTASLFPNTYIRMGPYVLVVQGDQLVIRDQGNHIRLDVENIVRIVKDKDKKPLQLLNHLTFPIEPGQLVAIVGGSGAGKSTLLRTLLGIEPITQGKVYLNGEDLHKNFNIYRNLIGYVPQYDIVHRDLKVKEVLYYAAKLRLPPDIDINSVIEKTLKQIDLSDRRDTLVKHLSGGQIKRVSMGVELLADPKLFFLDEPTSGLDPGLDKKMMELLAKLAKEGRTIVLVTHTTTNIGSCDRLVFLGKGGTLCYFGSPEDSLTFFQENPATQGTIKDFSDIYIYLDNSTTVQQVKDQFLNSSYHNNYVNNRLSQVLNANQFTPQKIKGSFWQQWLILSQRYGKILLGDKVNLGLTLLTAPIGISLITFAIRDKDPLAIPLDPDPTLAPLALRVLFVFTCAAIWVGLGSSLQEIVKETAIYTRERLVNLGIFSYLSSKISVLKALSLAQSLLIALVIFISFKSPQSDLFPWFLGLPITIYLTLVTSVTLGLMVSAIVTNITQANSLLPLLLLPQIIFSGVLFNMEGIGKYISWLMLSRWSVGALGALVNVNEMIPEPTISAFGADVPQLVEVSPVYNTTWQNLGINWSILMLHSLVYFVVTYFLQKQKDVL
ncbi:MAG: ATP-binding cassette domain-containing protein [Microcystaceae cyanobacterium]